MKKTNTLSGGSAALIASTMNIYTRLNIMLYRISGGRLMNTFPGGFPICILTTKGRKTGVRRDVPLLHIPFMDKKLLLASQGGLPSNPAWYYNVMAAPRVSITVHGETRHYQAVELSAGEIKKYWPHIIALYPDFAKYTARTDRDIPVLICSPVSA